MKKKVFETTFAKYFDEGIIGQGGSGQVHRVIDELGQKFAVKILDPAKASGTKLRRFKNEINFSLRNQHRNIISVIDHGLYKSGGKDSPFYVMPFYDGSLRRLIATGIAPAKVLHYFALILDGIEAAHLQKVFHRDLKPENILHDPKSDMLLIADFGIAHFDEDELYTWVETKPHERLANFQYAAPEQRTRGMEVDHRADIFAIGLILNEMFTGEVPHGTGFKTIESVASDYSYLDALVVEMIQQSPRERYASIEIIKQQLKARGLEFIESQKLDKLKQKAIPVSDIDDPLITDPPRIIEADWNNGMLRLIFSCPLNQKWHYALCNMGSYSAPWGKGPERFKIVGNIAMIDAKSDEVQTIIDYFKQWLPKANEVYKETIIREKRKEEEKERQRLKRQVEAEEERLRVLKSIRL
jgi:serine/threonine protein kinase